jgi:hypothetical protein
VSKILKNIPKKIWECSEMQFYSAKNRLNDSINSEINTYMAECREITDNSLIYSAVGKNPMDMVVNRGKKMKRVENEVYPAIIRLCEALEIRLLRGESDFTIREDNIFQGFSLEHGNALYNAFLIFIDSINCELQKDAFTDSIYIIPNTQWIYETVLVDEESDGDVEIT